MLFANICLPYVIRHCYFADICKCHDSTYIFSERSYFNDINGKQIHMLAINEALVGRPPQKK